ncbi:MAG: hypothetical protein WKG01_05390 [Kofleriaceae bacterium]
MSSSDKKKGKKRSRKTPVAGSPEAAKPIAAEQPSSSKAAGNAGATTPAPEPGAETTDPADIDPPAPEAGPAPAAVTTVTSGSELDADSDTETEVESPATATATDPDDGLIPWDDPDAVSMPEPDDLGTPLHAGELATASGAAHAAEQPGPPPGPPGFREGSTMLDPAAAAYEAARIAGEIVGDIESASGAAIVAAAAAGAAIEAARARRAAGEHGTAEPPSSAGHGTDEAHNPVVTVRMQRDRILRALADDIAANTEPEGRITGRIGRPRHPRIPGGSTRVLLRPKVRHRRAPPPTTRTTTISIRCRSRRPRSGGCASARAPTSRSCGRTTTGTTSWWWWRRFSSS